jgi:hypothetical protein
MVVVEVVVVVVVMVVMVVVIVQYEYSLTSCQYQTLKKCKWLYISYRRILGLNIITQTVSSVCYICLYDTKVSIRIHAVAMK